MLYPAKISFRNQIKIKAISNKEELREYVNRRHVIKECLQDVLQIENTWFFKNEIFEH